MSKFTENLLRIVQDPTHPCYEQSRHVLEMRHELEAHLLIHERLHCQSLEDWKQYLEKRPPSPETIAILIDVAVERYQSLRGKKAANARHDKPGGSRDKVQTICKIWASGKYSSRDICAEQECGALNMSYSAARKALKNTPNPSPWPGKGI